MTLQELSKYYDIQMTLEKDREALERLRQRITPASPQLTGMPHTPGVRDKVGDLAVELADMDERIRWLEELAAAARRAGVPLWIKDSEEIRAVIGGEPAQALPDALKRPKDRPTPHCAECEHCIKTQEGQRGTRKDCAIGWTAEGYEDGGPRHIPTRGNRQSPDWCPRRKDDAE